MRVVFADEAKAGLREIALYIARDNRARAQSFSRALREAAQEVGVQPRGFPVVVRHADGDIRRKAWHDYLIFYRINRDTVTIIDIQHGARDYSGLLNRESRFDD